MEIKAEQEIGRRKSASMQNKQKKHMKRDIKCFDSYRSLSKTSSLFFRS